MEEIWKAIPGYEGFYEASTLGNIKALERTVLKNGKEAKLKERILKRHWKRRKSHHSEYYMACLCRDGIPKYWYFHALIMLTFVGPRPEGAEICHGDGNPLNNRLDNLRYGTTTENRWDSHRHKTDRSGWHKLTPEDVKDIKAKCRTISKRKVAAEYGVTRAVINAISDWDRWEYANSLKPQPEYHI